MIDFKSLETFYWTVELKSFSRAANRLNTTQPSISQRIASIEEDMGIKLLERTTRTISITEKGRVLFEYAESFLRLRNKMIAELGASEEVRHSVRLGVSETVVHTWLSAFVEKAHAKYPDVLIDMTVDVSPTMQAGLVERDIDMAFMLGPVNDPSMTNIPLDSYPLEFIARKDLFSGGRVAIEKLVNIPVITFPKNTYPYTYLREMLGRAASRPPRIFTNSSLSTTIKMALDGIGVALIPAEVVQNEIASGVLAKIETELTLMPLEFAAVFPASLDDMLLERLAVIAQECCGFHKSRR